MRSRSDGGAGRARRCARLALLALPALPGCGVAGDDGAGDAVRTVVDTVADVPHVRHSGAAPAASLEPVLTLGEQGGVDEPSPEEFGRVGAVLADGDGHIYVADVMAHEIRVFGPDGAFLRRLGGKGAGPGEIGGMHGIAWLGLDTMMVADYGNARLTLLTTDGGHAGQWPWARITGGIRFLFGAGPGEAYAHVLRPRRDAEGGLQGAWARFTSAGARDSLEIPTLDTRPPGSGMLCRGGGGLGLFSNPFADRLVAAPAPGGERVVALASAYRLAFLDAVGDTVRVLAREAEPVPVADDEWAAADSAFTEFRRHWHGADCEGGVERPRSKPILRDLFFDHDGRLLVEYETADGLALDLFDRDWRWLATFPLPPGLRRSAPPFLRDDRLYLVGRDSLDIDRVRVYRVAPASDGRPGGD